MLDIGKTNIQRPIRNSLPSKDQLRQLNHAVNPAIELFGIWILKNKRFSGESVGRNRIPLDQMGCGLNGIGVSGPPLDLELNRSIDIKPIAD